MKIKVLILSLFAFMALNAGNLVTKSSNNSVNVTISKMEKIMKKKGITVFKVIDFRAGAKSIGADMTEAKLIIFGNPKLGTRIMQRDIKAAIELPMKILVYKDFNGKTQMEYKKPEALEHKYDLAGCSVLPKMAGALNKITTKAGM